MRGLRKKRQTLGLSLREVAAHTGIGVSTIGNFETGKTNLSTEALKKLAAFFKTTPAELAHFDVEPDEESPVMREDPPQSSAHRASSPVKFFETWKHQFLVNSSTEQLQRAAQEFLATGTPDALAALQDIIAELENRLRQQQAQIQNQPKKDSS